MALPTCSCPSSVLPVVYYISRPRLSCLSLCEKIKDYLLGRSTFGFETSIRDSFLLTVLKSLVKADVRDDKHLEIRGATLATC